MILRLNSKYQKLYGFGSFWAKYVEGFNNAKHCEPCLIGTRCRDVNKDIQTNTDIILPLKEGEILYICGVTYPYVWKNNFHLVVKGKDGASAAGDTFNGVHISVTDAEKVYFDDAPAKANYQHLGYSFYTCRNFQFGVYYFEYLKMGQKKSQLELF